MLKELLQLKETSFGKLRYNKYATQYPPCHLMIALGTVGATTWYHLVTAGWKEIMADRAMTVTTLE